MNRPYHHITVDRRGDAFCVRLSHHRLEETEVYELAGELEALVTEDGCRKLALSLGPGEPDCIYSVFLAKLITVQRVLREHGGDLLLCDASPTVQGVFRACQLESHFHFVADFPAALAHWGR